MLHEIWAWSGEGKNIKTEFKIFSTTLARCNWVKKEKKSLEIYLKQIKKKKAINLAGS